MRLCPVCSQENTDVARFCSACGASLTSEPQREERKVVSVLFADLVGQTRYRATRDVVEYAEHEPVLAKGKSEPIPVWEAVQVRSRLGMDVERATLPLVGRTRELGAIVDAFERARSEREPQLVTLVGVPGIGKSRLVGAFLSHLEGDPDLVWWRQGRALPYGDGVSFWAVAEMVKAQAGIAENDPPDVCAEKLRASVEQLVVDEAERDWVTDHLLPLVGVDHGGAGGDSAPAWRVFFESLAERRPLVMVFEDMHWADDGLLDFIDHLVDWAGGVPVLVLATARPELLDRRASWGGGKLNVSTIALTPLSDDEAAQIIHGVLEQAALPAGSSRSAARTTTPSSSPRTWKLRSTSASTSPRAPPARCGEPASARTRSGRGHLRSATSDARSSCGRRATRSGRSSSPRT